MRIKMLAAMVGSAAVLGGVAGVPAAEAGNGHQPPPPAPVVVPTVPSMLIGVSVVASVPPSSPPIPFASPTVLATPAPNVGPDTHESY